MGTYETDRDYDLIICGDGRTGEGGRVLRCGEVQKAFEEEIGVVVAE